MPKAVASCPETPWFANKSKFCVKHEYLDQPTTPTKKVRIVVTIDTLDLTVSTNILPYVQDLPNKDDRAVHVGCKSASSIDRFYERSAGVMAIVRPCGVIVD